MNEKAIWDALIKAGLTKAGAAGIIGNLQAESGCNPQCVEFLCLKRLREIGKDYTNEGYTADIDSGAIGRDGFLHPIPGNQYGYGVCQWTYPTRKAGLYDAAKAAGKSIGDLNLQIKYLLYELLGHDALWTMLRLSTDVEACSDAFLIDFERPADIAGQKPIRRENAKRIMAMYGQEGESMDFSKYAGMISNSGSDERGKLSGGRAGDQTGGEWRIRTWYDRPWNCVLRHPDPAVRAKLAELAVKAAQNDKIGYDQARRDTYWAQLQAVGYDPSKISTPCNADCSAGVIANTKAAGHILGMPALENITATYTGNMRPGFRAAGFQVLTDRKYLSGWQYLETGDILLNDIHHTAVYVGHGSAPASASASASAPVPAAPNPDQAGAGTDVSVFKRVQAATLTKASDARSMVLALKKIGIRSYFYKKNDYYLVGCGSWPETVASDLLDELKKHGITGIIW